MFSKPYIRVLGICLMLYSGALLPPIAISLIYQDHEALHLFYTLLTSLILGLALWLPTSGDDQKLLRRDGFIVVIMLWVVTSLLGSTLFIFGLDMSVSDAVFESVSAFTTTGSTVISGLDILPKSILFFRQEMQWLGGIGVVVTAIALLPMLGVGGMQLYKAEIPGPIKDEKLVPRIGRTAQALWKIYLAITVACAMLYWLGGMSLFDAVSHSFSTVSTGGFSTHDENLAYFNSTFIESVAVLFMLLGGIGFSVHFLVWKKLAINLYWEHEEVRIFLIVIAAFIVLVSSALFFLDEHSTLLESFHNAEFAVVSVITSTGLSIDDFSLWPTFLPFLLITIGFIGGCAGSTAGGIKVLRYIIVTKDVALEMNKLVNPRRVRPLRLHGKTVEPRIVDAVKGFFTAYVTCFLVLTLILMGLGLDHVTAYSAVATCINNLGPGLGDVAVNFSSVPDTGKWILVFAMLLGRLEILSLLVIFAPAFWKY
jgi:trk system potassium uptake protein TrkH